MDRKGLMNFHIITIPKWKNCFVFLFRLYIITKKVVGLTLSQLLRAYSALLLSGALIHRKKKLLHALRSYVFSLANDFSADLVQFRAKGVLAEEVPTDRFFFKIKKQKMGITELIFQIRRVGPIQAGNVFSKIQRKTLKTRRKETQNACFTRDIFVSKYKGKILSGVLPL